MTEVEKAPNAATGSNRHLLYIADPMCSWCYGFAPVIGEVAERLSGLAPVRVVMGGLKPGETRPTREKDKEYLRSAWTNVSTLSGQPFDEAFFDRQDFVYDTEPASRAVVTIRHVYPQEALGFLTRLSSAFYGANRDITDAGVIGDIAQEAGFNRAEFLSAFASDAARQATLQDFAMCQQAGIRGFPTLLGGSTGAGATGGYRMLTHGFCTMGELAPALEAWAAS